MTSAPTPGYSGRSTAQKLGIKPGSTAVLVDAPESWSVHGLPPDASIEHGVSGSFNLAILFVRSRVALDSRLPNVSARLSPRGSLWVAWPRRAGGHTSDVTEQAIRDAVLALGLVDVKVAALDNDWSGLKLMWRLSRRPS